MKKIKTIFFIFILAVLFYLLSFHVNQKRPVAVLDYQATSTEELKTEQLKLEKEETATVAVVNSVIEISETTALAEPVAVEANEQVSVNVLSSTSSSILPSLDDAGVYLKVPFTSQAPLGKWQDSRQQDGCEEAGVLMAIAWARGGLDLSPAAAEQAIIDLADWEHTTYGEHRDVYIKEVAERLFNDYFQYDRVKVMEIKNVEDLIAALRLNQLILAPTNGQILNNPHFTAPGPERHLLVITGYDAEKDEFITNDPGTRYGANYRYPSARLLKAIRNYPTGYHLPIIGEEKMILLVEK